MKKQYASITLAALLGLFVAGCAGTQKQAATAEPAKPTLSAEAQAALAQAEADAKAAKAAYTYWVPADAALKKAQEAAKVADSAAVIKQAKIVSDLCKISAQQPNYPTTELK
jgi:murein lipoprotein